MEESERHIVRVELVVKQKTVRFRGRAFQRGESFRADARKALDLYFLEQKSSWRELVMLSRKSLNRIG